LIRYCEKKGYSLDKTIEFLDAIGTYDKMLVYRIFQDSTDEDEQSDATGNVEEADSGANENSNKQSETVYCRYCGEEIFEDAVICPHCGRQVAPLTDNKDVEDSEESPWDNSNMLGLIVGTIIFPIIGLIAGIYGLIKPGKVGQGFVLLMLTVVAIIIWAGIIGCSSFL